MYTESVARRGFLTAKSYYDHTKSGCRRGDVPGNEETTKVRLCFLHLYNTHLAFYGGRSPPNLTMKLCAIIAVYIYKGGVLNSLCKNLEAKEGHQQNHKKVVGKHLILEPYQTWIQVGCCPAACYRGGRGKTEVVWL